MRTDTIDRELVLVSDHEVVEDVDTSRPCILVLGMHRSGTSALCGLLAELGAERPVRELPPQPDNEKGFFEPAEIIPIHDRVLHAAGTSWLGWDPIPDSFFETATCAAFRDELVAAARQDFPGTGAFVLKDPRICRFVGLWKTVLKDICAKPVIVNVFRHPLEVARSLGTRDNFSQGHCLLLWLRYVVDAEVATRACERTFVNYSNIMDDWRREFRTSIDRLELGLPKASGAPAADLDKFIEPQLRHQRATPEDLAADPQVHAWVNDAFDALHELHAHPYAAGAMRTLDRVRNEFDTACAAFASVVQATQERLAVAQAAADRVPRLEMEIEDLRRRLAAVQSVADKVPGLQAELGFVSEALATAAPLAGRVPDLETAIEHMTDDATWRWRGVANVTASLSGTACPVPLRSRDRPAAGERKVSAPARTEVHI